MILIEIVIGFTREAGAYPRETSIFSHQSGMVEVR
jgi:hypothetical protein